MELDKKTEIVDEYIGEALKKLYKDYEGEIQFISDSHYLIGRIIIKVKD